jgi:serine/threonine-protein kinase HipA
MNLLEVKIWGELIGVLIWNETAQSTSFEFSKNYLKGNFDLSPLINPKSPKVITQKEASAEGLSFESFKGLPLFISDTLPDKFGTELFAKYLEREGKNFRDLNPLEKLAYIGERGMGALEFEPNKYERSKATRLDLGQLNKLSKSLLNNQPISHVDDMANLFHVGTSPGGAQPKILINIDTQTGDIYRGDHLPTENQDSWVLKFNNNIRQESDKFRGKIEYAYYLMAKGAGIEMMESRLEEVDGEFCFMTKRFDRLNEDKIHTQTLHAFAGMNFMLPNTYSYEQVFTVLNKMNLGYKSKEQLFRVMVFNIISRNVDDHTKNFGFSMNKQGNWKLSPAYDLTFSYNENYNRPIPHFLSANSKNENHNLEDILTVAKEHSIKKPKHIINEINQSLLQWNIIATELKISNNTKNTIASKMKTFPYSIV